MVVATWWVNSAEHQNPWAEINVQSRLQFSANANTRQYILWAGQIITSIYKLPQILAVKMLNKSQTKQNLDDR